LVTLPFCRIFRHFVFLSAVGGGYLSLCAHLIHNRIFARIIFYLHLFISSFIQPNDDDDDDDAPTTYHQSSSSSHISFEFIGITNYFVIIKKRERL